MGAMKWLGYMEIEEHLEVVKCMSNDTFQQVQQVKVELFQALARITILEQEKKELLTRLEEKSDTKPHRAKSAAEIRRAFDAMNSQATPEG